MENMGLSHILARFDQTTEKIDEHEISDAIRKYLNEQAPSSTSTELLAELMAFDFCEDYQDKDTGWGTYYGPMAVWATLNHAISASDYVVGGTLSLAGG